MLQISAFAEVSMTIIKSHDCKMCGGPLDIDLDRQVYICPFCGVTYDYEYFRADNVREMARKALAAGEFGAAKDAFEFIISKDPHDFEALCGLILCRNKKKTMSSIMTGNGVHFSEKLEELVFAKDNCLPEHRDYFEKISEAARLFGKYKEKQVEVHRLESKRDEEAKTLGSLKHEYINIDNRFMNSVEELMEENTSKGASLFTAILAWITVGICVIAYFGGWVLLAAAAVIIAFYAVYCKVKKNKKLKELRIAIVSSESIMEELSEEIRNKKVEAEEIHAMYREKKEEISASDPLKTTETDSDDGEKAAS